MCIETIKSAEVQNLLGELNSAHKASLLKGFCIQSNPAKTRHLIHIYLLDHHWDTRISFKLLKHIETRYKNSVIAVTDKSEAGPSVINVYLDARL